MEASPADARREGAFRMCYCGFVRHRCRWMGLESAAAFDEVLDRWLRLPCDLPLDGELSRVASVLL